MTTKSENEGDASDASPVMTVEQAARYLSISRNAAYESVRRGQIFSLRIGRSIRIPRKALERFLDSAASPSRE